MSKIEVIDATDGDLQKQIRDGIDKAIDESVPLFHPAVNADGAVTALDFDTARVDVESVWILREFHTKMAEWFRARGVDGPALLWHESYAAVLGQLAVRLVGAEE